MEQLALMLVMWGRMELGMLVFTDGCADAKEVAAVFGPSPSPATCYAPEDIDATYGIETKFETSLSIIRVVKNAGRLPKIAKILRERRWAVLKTLDPSIPIEYQPYGLISYPAISYNGSYTRPDGTVRHTLKSSGDFLYGSLTATVQKYAGTWRNPRFQWERESADHRIEVGDITGSGGTRHGRLTQGRGLRVRTLPVSTFTTNIEGKIDDAGVHDVELRLRSTLIDTGKFEGAWKFTDVPVYGTTRWEVRMYPQGGVEPTVESGTIYGGGGRLAPGTMALDGSVVQEARNLLTLKDDHRPTRRNTVSHLQGYYGVSEDITVTVGVRDDILGRSYHGGALMTVWNSPVEIDVTRDPAGKMALGASGNIKGVGIDYERRQHGFRMDREQRYDERLRLSRAFSAGRVSGRIKYENKSLLGQRRHELSLDGRVPLTGGIALRGRATYLRGREASVRGSTGLYGRFHGVRYAGTVDYHLYPERYVSAYRLRGSHGAFDAGLSFRPATDALALNAGYTLNTEQGRVRIGARASSDGFFGLSVTLNTNVAVTPDKRAVLHTRPKAHVSVRVFVDLDGDGHYGQSDKPLAGALVPGVGKTDAEGWAQAWMQAGRVLTITVREDLIDDPRVYDPEVKRLGVRLGALNTAYISTKWREL